MTCHHRLWIVHTVESRRAWHALIAFGQHTRSNDVWRGMPSSPLDITHGRQRQSWHDITSLGKHTRSDDVEHGMTSSPLDSTHGRTTSGVACHHCLWTARTVERHRAWHHHRLCAAQTIERLPAWHVIIAFGLAHTIERRRVLDAIIAL